LLNSDKAIEYNETLTILFKPNSLMNYNNTYLLTVSLKEKILYYQ
jgi:hypothetical protein